MNKRTTPNLKPYTGPTKPVIAFDIGTTCSGISYSILTSGQVPKVFGIGPVQGDAKIPSTLYYDKSGVVRAAGAEVLDENIVANALAEGWTKAEWWKLHLRPSHMASCINHNMDLPPLPTGKSAVDVLSDFIQYLFTCAKTYIIERHPTLVWSTAEKFTEYIFTHPNGWEGLQLRQYRQAIERAGLVPKTHDGHSRVHMVAEGEASLHYCLSNLGGRILNPSHMDEQPGRRGAVAFDTDNRTERPGCRGAGVAFNASCARNPLHMDRSDPQGVVVINAGGGAIDLSMYSVASNPISLCEEIAPSQCRLQGSVFVTRRAEALLQKKLEGWEGLRDRSISKITREFDRSTKLIIESDQEPVHLVVAGRRASNPTYNISFGKLKLSGTEATGLFNESVDAIIDAFEQQLRHATIPIATAFLIGGLSSNDWVWSQLRSYFERRHVPIYRPRHQADKAAAHGAVLSHLRTI